MADINLQMSHRNADNTGWDNLYPVTKVDNVLDSTGNSHMADYVRQPGFGTTTGSANAYTLTLTPALKAYTAGVCVAIKIHAANTGASTLSINGLGAKTILDSKGNALISGKLRLNVIYTLRYDGTNFILQGEGGEYGTATADKVLTGYSIGTENGLVNGTMPNRANDQEGISVWVPPEGQVINIGFPQGAYITDSGFGAGIAAVKKTDPNFIAANFLATKNIFGLQGSIPVRTNTENNGSYPDAAAVSVYENMLYMRPPTGYYDSTVWVQRYLAGLTSANIRSGIQIGDGSGNSLVGTLVPLTNEKKYATGSATAAAWSTSGNGYITVTGLNFRPRIIVTYQASRIGVYNADDGDAYYLKSGSIYGSSNSERVLKTLEPTAITDSSFVIYVWTNNNNNMGPVRWWAFE